MNGLRVDITIPPILGLEGLKGLKGLAARSPEGSEGITKSTFYPLYNNNKPSYLLYPFSLYIETLSDGFR